MFRKLFPEVRRFTTQLLKTSRKPKKVHRPRARLGVEALETRNLLDGTVLAHEVYGLVPESYQVSVEVTVSADVPGYEGLYLWQYHVTSGTAIPSGLPIYFDLLFDAGADVANVTSPPDWTVSVIPASGVFWGTTIGIEAGSSGDFSFTTDPRPLVLIGAEAGVAGFVELTGGVYGPGAAAIEPQITFLDYELSPNNSDENLFASSEEAYPLPLIELSVLVEGIGPGGETPTGIVTFTAILSGGDRITLGDALVDANGKVTIELDSGFVGQPGLEIEAAYSGDAFFAATTKMDNGKTANDVRADPPVTDNPAVPADAQNLTVVVVTSSGAERRQWRDSARRYYGAGAYIITDVHSVADLGARLANLPAGSISRLVISAHGWDTGPWLGTERLNNATVNANPVARGQIRAALANNALIDHQSCGSFSTQAGRDNMQALANTLNSRVRGTDKCAYGWDVTDPDGTWITVNPQ